MATEQLGEVVGAVAIDAFDLVVARHGATVLRVCRAVVGPDDADDVWAETFLAALRAYPDLPDGANVQAWLVTIARRKGIDCLRARQRRAIPTAVLPEPRGDTGFDTADRLDLMDAVQALPLKQREAVAYHHLAGLPYAQIAVLTNGSEASARRAAADGMKALRRALAAGRPAVAGSERTRPDVGQAGASTMSTEASP